MDTDSFWYSLREGTVTEKNLKKKSTLNLKKKKMKSNQSRLIVVVHAYICLLKA